MGGTPRAHPLDGAVNLEFAAQLRLRRVVVLGGGESGGAPKIWGFAGIRGWPMDWGDPPRTGETPPRLARSPRIRGTPID